MSYRRWLRRLPGRVAAVAAALLMVAVAACLLDPDPNGVDDPGTDLCNVALLASLTIAVLVGPLLSRDARGDRTPAYRRVTLPILDPPPEPALLP